MKKILLLLSFSLSISLQSQSIGLQDTMTKEIKKIKTLYFFSAQELTKFNIGTELLFIGSKPNFKKCDYLYIATEDTTLIGVYLNGKKPTYLLDTSGNSVLGISSDFFILPLWLTKKYTHLDKNDYGVFALLDSLYEQTLQCEENELDKLTLEKFNNIITDTSLANRHIASLFYDYQTIITYTAVYGVKVPSSVCLYLMQNLNLEFNKLFNKIPAIVYIYTGEALQSAGLTAKATIYFKHAITIYPNSIPLMVYNYLHEDIEILKSITYKYLKDHHGNHWMVKPL